MMEAVKEWIMRLTGTAMISAAVLSLVPDGKTKKAVRLVCGVAILASMLSLGVSFDDSSFSKHLAYYRSEAEKLEESAAEQNKTLTRLIIEEESTAYISDKAAELGIENISVSVRAEWSEEGWWYPTEATIISDAGESEKAALKRFIAAELGISEERQRWSGYEQYS